MSRVIFLRSGILIALLASIIGLGILPAQSASPLSPLAADWSGWASSNRLSVQNNAAVQLPSGYTVSLTLNTAALIDQGGLLPDCSDLRISADQNGDQELDRLVTSCNTTATNLQFRTQAAIPAGGVDQGYWLHTGNPSAGAPPQNPAHVFSFFDDFQDGDAAGWNAAKGAWGVVSEGSNYLYRYTGGGANWAISYVPLSDMADLDYTARIRASDTTTSIGLAVRIQNANNFIALFHSRDPNYFKYARIVNDSDNERRRRTFVMPVNTWYRIHVQAIGDIVRARIWPDGGTEPTTWLINYVDATFQTQTNLGAALAFHNTSADWDDFQARRLVEPEPSVIQLSGPGPVQPQIANIQDNGPLNLGAQLQASADVSTTEGVIDTVTLSISSPLALDLPMSLVSGDAASGTWQAVYTPAQAGLFSYRVRAQGSNGAITASEEHSFSVSDASPPSISLVSLVDPISQYGVQTVVVQVSDNGAISQVSLTAEGSTNAMSAIGGGQYRYSWPAANLGTIPFTVQAVDAAGNAASYEGSFDVIASQAVDAGVCTWKDCKTGAASWSIDDGISACKADLEAAGFRGTYYSSGPRLRSWFAEYSAAGHEVGAHTLGHTCPTPACSPNCTPESLMAIPIDPVYVEYYRKKQLDANIQVIETGTGKPVLSLAWPCGCVDPSRMEAAKPYFLGARGYFDTLANLYWVDDVNLPNPVNLWNLNGASYYRQIFIDRAASEGKWAIITSHGSCDGIAYMGSQSDKLWLAPVGEVLKYIYVREAAQFSNYDRSGQTIQFDVAHNLPTFNRQTFLGAPLLPIVYDNPVTLKVHLEQADTVQSVTVDGAPVPFTERTIDGVKYVTFDSALLGSRHVVVQLN